MRKRYKLYLKGLTKKDKQMFNEILRKGNNGISRSIMERIV